MADLTAEQKEVLDHTLQAVQRIALAMLDISKDEREQQYAMVRRNFERALQAVGIEGQAGQDWLDVTMRALRAFVAEIEAGGGAQGGEA